MSKGKYKNGEQRLVGIIGDEDTCTGFLLAGTGDATPRKGHDVNFIVVDKTTTQAAIEEAFSGMVKRKDIGIILICQHIANDIRYLIDQHKEALPCVLEIPSKQVAYDPAKDVVLQRLRLFLGEK